MEKVNNSSSFIKFIKTIFKPIANSQKNNKREHQPRWMYRNE